MSGYEGELMLKLFADDMLHLEIVSEATSTSSSRFVTDENTDTFINDNRCKNAIYKTDSKIKIYQD